jgi:hypothetical protein
MNGAPGVRVGMVLSYELLAVSFVGEGLEVGEVGLGR